jgi:hypothetical protein
MSDDRSNAPVSRRDTLRLATAVSALGIGLGVSLESKDASAQVRAPLTLGGTTSIKLDASKLGPVSLKLYKLNPDGQNFDLLHTLDLSALFIKGEGAKENVVSMKLFNQKADQAVLISGHDFHIVTQKF